MTQRGFIALPLGAWAAIAAAAAIGVLGVALKVQTARLDAVKAEYAAFVAKTEALGKAANELAKKQAKDDRKKKESADYELRKARSDLSRLGDAYRSLRDARTRSGFLSAPAPGAPSPDRTCLDRAVLERTLGEIDAVGAGISAEGDQTRIGLDAAKRWAQ